MGFLIAIALGLAYQPISKSQVVQGKLSLSKTFWLYAIAIGGVIFGVAMWNFSSSIGEFEGNPEGALRLGVFVAGYYSLFVFLAIWRSSKQATFLWKWGARYVSLFFLSCAVAAVMYSLVYVLLTAITVFLVTKMTKGNLKVINTSGN